MRTMRALAGLSAAGVLLLPVVAHAAAGEVPAADWGRLTAGIINFAVYLAIIITFAKKPVLAAFANRRQVVLAQVTAAEQARAEAQARVDGLRAELDRMDSAREQMIREFREMGTRERDRQVEQARATADKLLHEVELQLAARQRQAEKELQQKIMNRALAVAADKLQEQASADMRQHWLRGSMEALVKRPSARA
jgi:F-type H+-transporting ATPase subunit b